MHEELAEEPRTEFMHEYVKKHPYFQQNSMHMILCIRLNVE